MKIAGFQTGVSVIAEENNASETTAHNIHSLKFSSSFLHTTLKYAPFSPREANKLRSL